MKIYKFSTPFCCMCKQVSILLDKKGVKYEEIDCTLDKNKNMVESYNIHGVPVVIIIDDNGYMKRLNNIAEVKDWLAHTIK